MASHRPTLLADGGQHFAAEGKAYDQTRSQALQAKGIRIIRFSDVDILRYPEAVQAAIYRELTPSLTLPRSTGGGRSEAGVSAASRHTALD